MEINLYAPVLQSIGKVVDAGDYLRAIDAKFLKRVFLVLAWNIPKDNAIFVVMVQD